VAAPEKIVIVLDHVVPAASDKHALNHKIIREFVEEQKLPHFFDIEAGVCHQVFCEQSFALPGLLITGSDSHTTTYGAFGSLAIGIGRTETASIWATDDIWLQVPETIKFVLKGKLQAGVMSKDVILRLIGGLGAEGANYKAVEFTGEAAASLSLESRMVVTNMAAEMGAKNGYFEPDALCLEWLRGRARREFEPVFSDPDAHFEAIYEYDLSNMSPQVACPHSVDNDHSVSEVSGTIFHQALLGTCTNGRLEDLEMAVSILKGKKLAGKAGCLFCLPPGKFILRRCGEAGLKSFMKLEKSSSIQVAVLAWELISGFWLQERWPFLQLIAILEADWAAAIQPFT
jgi:homoaconitase/3-isopropylmalate dehydratase large subunit